MKSDAKKAALVVGTGILTGFGLWVFNRHVLPRLPAAVR